MPKMWNGSVKSVYRPILVYKEKPAKAAFFMPGNTALCIETALQTKSINGHTTITCIDKDWSTLAASSKIITEFGLKKVEYAHVHLKGYHFFDTPKRAADFAYFDTCGEISEDILISLYKMRLKRMIAPDCTIAFTFSSFSRWNTLSGEIAKLCSERVPSKRIKTEISKRHGVRQRCITIAKMLLAIFPDHELTFGHSYKEIGIAYPMFSGRLTHKDSPDKNWQNALLDLGYK